MAQSLDIEFIERGFVAGGLPSELVRELLASFVEAKRRYHLGDFRPNAVEGGRFSEAALRILQWQTSGKYTPLHDPKFKADTAINGLAQLPAGSFPESVRLDLPRALRVIYDIRNKRNTAHLSDGIDPNTQDSTLVVSILDWALAELVRLHHNVSASEAQAIIETLVRREVPMIQEFDGKPRILKSLTHADHILVLAYWWGDRSLDRRTLGTWLPTPLRKNPGRAIASLHAQFLVTATESSIHITQLGMRSVEQRRLIESL